jgi:ATP-dependent helicase/nuclease subunit B
MRILFGENINSQKYTIGINELSGDYICNLNSLTSTLALFLGTKKEEESYPTRLEKYRQALSANSKNSFYEKSFTRNQIAVSKNLLGLRDELKLNGYNFTITDDTPERLKLLCQVESSFDSSRSFSDVYIETLEALKTKKIQIPFNEIVVFTPENLLSIPSQKILKLLSDLGIEIKFKNIEDANRDKKCDLEKLVEFLKSKERFDGFEGDGSVQLLVLDDEIESYQIILDKFKEDTDISFYIPEHQTLVDSSLSALGLPNIGSRNSSQNRPLAQLIKLMEIFLWERTEPSKLLEFLSLRNKPLNMKLASMLAEVLSDMPGIGSDSWEEVLKEYQDNSDIEEDVRTKALEQYSFLFKRKKFDESAANIKEVIDLYKGLVKYYKNFSMVNEERRGMALKCAAIVESLIDVLEHRGVENDISKLELDNIISTLHIEIDFYVSNESKGRMSLVTSPELLLSEVKKLVWIPFLDNLPAAHTSILKNVEIEYLESKDVIFLGQGQRYLSMYTSEIRMISQISEQVVFCLPNSRSEAATHPILLELESLGISFDNLKIGVDELETSNKEVLNRFNLPRPMPVWNVTPNLLLPRKYESYSSMDKLINYPFQYVLGYHAKLHPYSMLEVNDGSRLLGSFTHRLYEEFFNEYKDQSSIDEGFIKKWHEDNFLLLIEKEASVLLMQGREGEFEFIKQKSLESLIYLSMTLKENGWKVVEMEHEFSEEVNGITITGFIDMFLERGDEHCALDIKWGSAKYYKDIISNNKDMQLGMYSKLSPSNCPYSHTAFFSILNTNIFSKNKSAFNNAIAYPEQDHIEAYSEMWDKMINSYDVRVEQIKNGIIEVPTDNTVDQIESILDGENTFEAAESGPRFNDYDVLCGWNDDE